jgi:endonuclease YncB( thermonuclease family)
VTLTAVAYIVKAAMVVNGNTLEVWSTIIGFHGIDTKEKRQFYWRLDDDYLCGQQGNAALDTLSPGIRYSVRSEMWTIMDAPPLSALSAP